MPIARAPRRPNVLLIVLDAVRADRLSCYGYHRPTTPHLERLAEEAWLFEHAFAAAPWTPPSHASLFTGTYPSRHGVDVDENLHLGPDLPTLAGLLAEAGYATFAVIPDAHLSRARGLDRGFRETVELFRIPYVSPEPVAALALARNLLLGRDGRAWHAARLLKRWIHRHVQTSDAPFCAFVNFKTAHSSYRAPRAFRRRFALRPGPDQDPARLRRYANGGGYPYMVGGLPMSARDLAVVASWYEAAIAYLDHRVGDLLGFLRRLGVDDRTLVIVTADHGENFGDHSLAYHLFCLYDSLLRVPLLVRLPGAARGGRRLRGLASLTDVLPTVLEVVGLDPARAPEVQGRSLLASDLERRPAVFAEFGRPHYMLKRLVAKFPGHDFSRFDRALRCIRTAEFKLIVGSDGSEELYHLPSDPGESTNVVARHPVEAARLRRALGEWSASFREARPGAPAPDDDAVVLKNLEDLGYF